MDAEQRHALHAVPEQPFTVEQAHREMERHRACRAADFALKEAAREVLVRAPSVVPADRGSKVVGALPPDRGLRWVRTVAAGEDS
ncbi:hypothetical protein AB0H71_12635 [Nocardia sp. NPDC050697]|uniref:hypothetical protein n=1 Tax=Nocardia sp. NPDC050697 TaxID=3155158 RepID=UPI0033C02270